MEQKNSSSTIDKAFDVLFLLHQAQQAQGVTALAQALDMPKSSVHRLLSVLTRRGLVERDEHGRYAVGFGLVALGLGVLEREPAVIAAKPILEQHAQALGETFFLVAAHAGQLMVLDKAEGNGFLRAAPQLGSIVPVHATAVGKLYLAFDPQAVQLDTNAFTAYTPVTVCHAAALDIAVAQAREQGWASNLDEWQTGLSVLAAPVFCAQRLVATVALALATPRLESLGIDQLVTEVISAAAQIQSRLEGIK